LVAASISAIAGDDKRAGTCLGKFNQLVNHLGFQYIPARNPQFQSLATPKPSGGKK
jgi:hypothetical protein